MIIFRQSYGNLSKFEFVETWANLSLCSLSAAAKAKGIGI